MHVYFSHMRVVVSALSHNNSPTVKWKNENADDDEEEEEKIEEKRENRTFNMQKVLLFAAFAPFSVYETAMNAIAYKPFKRYFAFYLSCITICIYVKSTFLSFSPPFCHCILPPRLLYYFVFSTISFVSAMCTMYCTRYPFMFVSHKQRYENGKATKMLLELLYLNASHSIWWRWLLLLWHWWRHCHTIVCLHACLKSDSSGLAFMHI